MPAFNALGTGIARPLAPVAPRPSPQPMTYGAPPLQGTYTGAPPPPPAPSFGRPLPGLGATPASPNYGRATAAPLGANTPAMPRTQNQFGGPPAPAGQDPMAAQQMLARGRANTMPQTSAPPTSALPNPQRAAGSGAGPMVTNVGGKMFYR